LHSHCQLGCGAIERPGWSRDEGDHHDGCALRPDAGEGAISLARGDDPFSRPPRRRATLSCHPESPEDDEGPLKCLLRWPLPINAREVPRRASPARDDKK